MAERTMSRRGFLKAAGLFGAATLLDACTPQAAGTPPASGLSPLPSATEAQQFLATLTPTQRAVLTQALTGTPAPVDTAAPATGTSASAEAAQATVPAANKPETPTATPVPTIAKERFTHGYAEMTPPSQELIEQGKKTGVICNPEDIGQLTFDVRDNLRRKGEKIVFARDPKTKEIILATRVNPETHEMEWHVAGLRDMADAVGMIMGTNLYTPGGDLMKNVETQNRINELVVQEYNKAIVIDVGWGTWVEKHQEGQFDFSAPDATIKLALDKGMMVEGDDLVYGSSNYAYSFMGKIEDTLRKQGLNDQQIKDRVWGIVKNHVQTVVSHYKGVVKVWSAVNEYRGPELEHPDIYSRISLGDDDGFLAMVFGTAKEADPSAILMYNDTDINTPSDFGYKLAYKHVQKLKQKGLIDAVGVQMTDINCANPPNPDVIKKTMQSWGLPVIVSSATFATGEVKGDKAQTQAKVAGSMFDASIQSGVCNDFSFWQGFAQQYNFHGADQQATIFDEEFKPKPAYFTFKNRLTQMVDQGVSMVGKGAELS